MPPITKTFEAIGLATVARSAEEARDILVLRPGDDITMNRDRLLTDAKDKVLALAENYTVPDSQTISLPGRTAAVAIELAVDGFRQSGKATAHDVTVSGELARVLSGGDTDITASLSEDDVLDLERDAFVTLAGHPASIARVTHMLKTGKPLRN